MKYRYQPPPAHTSTHEPTCQHCGKRPQWAWISTPGGTFCHDCFYALYPQHDGTIATDDNYNRRLL